MASLNLSKNAKRAAYAHISFNIIGVAVTIPLFFVSMDVLIHYEADAIAQATAGLAERARHSLIFTYAPGTPL